MNKLSLHIISLFIIFTISVVDVNCENTQTKCIPYNDKCNKNVECCTGNCVQHFKFLKGYCDIGKNVIQDINNYYLTNTSDDQIYGLHAKCIYVKEKNELIKHKNLKKFRINAANSKLPPNAVVGVIANGFIVDVTINEDPTKDDGITYLSEAAAFELGVEEEGVVFPCKILLPNYGLFFEVIINGVFIFLTLMPIVGIVVGVFHILF